MNALDLDDKLLIVVLIGVAVGGAYLVCLLMSKVGICV